MQPAEIRLNRERTQLSVTWENGETSYYPAARLREQARDARSVRRSLDGLAPAASAGLTITGLEPIGNYALRLAFSDGHDRGIFPWAYLADIAGENSRHGALSRGQGRS